VVRVTRAAAPTIAAVGSERFSPGLGALARPVESLREDPANVRRHPERNLETIKASLVRFGQQKPIVVRRDGVVVAGNGTLRAARDLGWKRIAAVTTDLVSTDATAYAIADNRTAELAAWDGPAVAALMRELAEDDAGIMDDLGFDEADLDALDAEGIDVEGDEDEAAAATLAERFLVPPFSVLDARAGYWQERKQAWLALGIQSELGRAEGAPGGGARPATGLGPDGRTQRGDGAGRPLRTWVGGGRASDALDPVSRQIIETGKSAASVFDPVLCELVYRWFSPPGGRVLDPFAGGAVRGIVASRLGRDYVGIELRTEQVAANRAQLSLAGEPRPVWIEGDARDVRRLIAGQSPFDLVFSCPPYADLEVYSDDPRDLSTLDYPAFVEAYRAIVRDAIASLAPDRFAVFVVGDVRGREGFYRGFVGDTVRAFEDAGARLYNEAALVTMVGSLSLRAGRQFAASRKLGKAHQNVLVFVKGDPRRATAACGLVEVGTGDEPGSPGDQDADESVRA
jgi:hypothetical protein